jgi:hypothetical protein
LDCHPPSELRHIGKIQRTNHLPPVVVRSVHRGHHAGRLPARADCNYHDVVNIVAESCASTLQQTVSGIFQRPSGHCCLFDPPAVLGRLPLWVIDNSSALSFGVKPVLH